MFLESIEVANRLGVFVCVNFSVKTQSKEVRVGKHNHNVISNRYPITMS